MIRNKQTIYEFELSLTCATELNKKITDALFEAGCDDALLSSQTDKVWLTFAREAPTFKDAVLSAISNIHAANINATVLHVEEVEGSESTNPSDLILINQMLELFRPATK